MDLRYPIGVYEPEEEISDSARREFINQIERAPALLRDAVDGLDQAQLDSPYRPEGWTVRQVVHHLADSHINAYVRFRLALTEDLPTIKTYREDRWAELVDAKAAAIDMSLTLLDALHQRWVLLLRSLSTEDCARTLQHPELGMVGIGPYIGLYAWHGRHHVAHITSLRERQGW